MTDLMEKHRTVLDQTVEALSSGVYKSPFPEIPSGKNYGESAKGDGLSAFQSRRSQRFALSNSSRIAEYSGEVSPWTRENLGPTYEVPAINNIRDAAVAAMPEWGKATIDERVSVLIEAMTDLNEKSFEMAHAIMHTTGQPFMMAFQAGGPHALDKGLEAVARSYELMMQRTRNKVWKRSAGKRTLEMAIYQDIVPMGVSLNIACSTFPTWNTYAGLFASLASGNPVIVKPHPDATLPLAIAVESIRVTLTKYGHNPDLLTIAYDTPDLELATGLVKYDAVKIIDYTGNTEFGDWIRDHSGSKVFIEPSAVNSVFLESSRDLGAALDNLAFSICLYSGQMCTSPTNIFIPTDGVYDDGRLISYDDTISRLKDSIHRLLSDPKQAEDILGAIRSQKTLDFLHAMPNSSEIILESNRINSEQYPEAQIHTPLLREVHYTDVGKYSSELFGPMVNVIRTNDSSHGLGLLGLVAESGSMVVSLYSASGPTIIEARKSITCPLAVNMQGGVFANQSPFGIPHGMDAIMVDDRYVDRFDVSNMRQM